MFRCTVHVSVSVKVDAITVLVGSGVVDCGRIVYRPMLQRVFACV